VSENRDGLMQQLKASGIPTMVYYSKCMHQQSAFKYLGVQSSECIVADRLSKVVFSLPMHPYLPVEDQLKIVNALVPSSSS
jgi:dTDP-4-amino-4,6-dideoxygalactose transaminase